MAKKVRNLEDYLALIAAVQVMKESTKLVERLLWDMFPATHRAVMIVRAINDKAFSRLRSELENRMFEDCAYRDWSKRLYFYESATDTQATLVENCAAQIARDIREREAARGTVLVPYNPKNHPTH